MKSSPCAQIGSYVYHVHMGKRLVMNCGRNKKKFSSDFKILLTILAVDSFLTGTTHDKNT